MPSSLMSEQSITISQAIIIMAQHSELSTRARYLPLFLHLPSDNVATYIRAITSSGLVIELITRISKIQVSFNSEILISPIKRSSLERSLDVCHDS